MKRKINRMYFKNKKKIRNKHKHTRERFRWWMKNLKKKKKKNLRNKHKHTKKDMEYREIFRWWVKKMDRPSTFLRSSISFRPRHQASCF